MVQGNKKKLKKMQLHELVQQQQQLWEKQLQEELLLQYVQQQLQEQLLQQEREDLQLHVEEQLRHIEQLLEQLHDIGQGLRVRVYISFVGILITYIKLVELMVEKPATSELPKLVMLLALLFVLAFVASLYKPLISLF
ncbi:hypothetical protein QVD17_38421 [Tagetes erecta]|uniref:Uncharacterized protein n=1 Tax=Tagetes erecta TaxID=13708 RepID=A0AAD8JNW6_TARER|nr:hypothetical protein QVD17_38421 [Tagetes erecta]